MTQKDGLLCAYRLDGRGGGAPLGWEDLEGGAGDAPGLLWLHMDYQHPRVQEWVHKRSGLSHANSEAFLAEDTRPRCATTAKGLLVILRGVNLNPGAEPDDMVSVRALIGRGRVITLLHRRLRAIEDIEASLQDKAGPGSAGEFIVRLAGRIAHRMGDVLSNLDDLVDDLEDSVLTRESRDLRSRLSDVRRQMIRMRRYLAPQRDVLAQLQNERVDWLSDVDRIHIREIADRTTRYVEDLDAARDRAAITQEELGSLLTERMERTMYMLSIVAAIFLPLSLLTGLLGINVGGMPGAENPLAFWAVCLLLGALAVLQIWFFKRMKWF